MITKNVIRGIDSKYTEESRLCLIEEFELKSLVVFNDGGIEFLSDKQNYKPMHSRREIQSKRNRINQFRKNILISPDNTHVLTNIKDSGAYFYYGETIDNKRHGWGFLADKNGIMYEGMWYLDRVAGWYLLYCSFMVEFGYLDHFFIGRGFHRSQIFCSKETEIILSDRFSVSNDGFSNKYFELNNYLNTYLSENCIDSRTNSEYSIENFGVKLFQKVVIDNGALYQNKTPRQLQKSSSGYLFHSNDEGKIIHDFTHFGDQNLSFSNETDNRKADHWNDTKTEYDVSNIITDKPHLNYDGKQLSLSFTKENCGDSPYSSQTFNILHSLPIFARDCSKWSTDTISLILSSSGLVFEAMIFKKNKFTGSEIPMLSDHYLKEIGVSDQYSRKFILKLFRQIWGFIDYMDLSLKENLKLRNFASLKYINSSKIEFENFVSGNRHCFILDGYLNQEKIICKVYAFSVENYDIVSHLNFKNNCEKDQSNLLDYNFDDLKETNDQGQEKNGVFPVFYIYKYRRELVSLENLCKYTPTPVKMRNWEGRILNYLGPHPNIVRCIGITQIQKGCEALLLENCEGGSMDKYLFSSNTGGLNKVDSKFSADRIEMLSWLRDIANGMHHAHELGILHRDLKLSNYFISTAGGKKVGKVGDFGIAVSIDPILGYTTLTEYGNAYYAAPEVIRKEGFFKESDVWSFGISMLEVLEKSLVFDGFTPGLAMVINAGNIETFYKISSNVPFHLQKLLSTILSPNMKLRPSFQFISSEISRIIENSEESFLRNLYDFHAY
ncbi:putative tyrosine kinase-like protein [Cryptosporidium felis]|nr:putative tyrosine kinase-like protein [Cryptosporidium felis]